MIDINEISQEYLKCYTDLSRVYMITHYLKTYDATQRKEVPFNLFPKQRELCHMLADSNDICTSKPRQSGITTTCGAYIACQIALADPDSPLTILVIGNTLDLAQQMVTKIKDFLYQFPRWFWGDRFFDPDPENPKNKAKIFKLCNQKELLLENGCRVVARSSGPDASRGVGGVSYLIFDEAAFIEKGKDVYASALATVSTGGHVIMISTPNGKDQLYYETYRQALEGRNSFKVIELRWYQDPRYNKHLEWTRKNDDGEIEIIKEPTIDDAGNIEYNEKHWEDMVRQGYKPRSPWYVRMCKGFNNNPQKIAQELDVSFLGSDSNVVDPEYIEMQRNLNVREPDLNYRDAVLEEMWIWKPPIEGHRYLMGIDNSRGDSEDATALEIIDIDGIDDDGMPCIEQVAEYNGKLLGDAIGEIAFSYGHMYNDAFIIVESIGGYGDATLLTLMRLGYENLYYDDPSLKKYTSQNDASSLQVTKDGLPGFHSSSVRFQMLANFANMVKTNQLKIRSVRVCNELETWIFAGPKMDHKDGCHDDTLTCLAMTLFVMEFSIKRQMKLKMKDATMIDAMIQANNRLVFDPYRIRKNNSEKGDMALPAYNASKLNGVTDTRSEKYKQYMWLIV
jgi:hypothetical protein